MIDDTFLHETGVYDGLNSKERKAFLDHCKSELDRRVGEVLSDLLTSDQIATFEEFMNQGESGARDAIVWITQVVPDYDSIVLKTLGELKTDIINNRDNILG
ncbi:DUF5663 domain-containing protein [Candidatus Saccharibacteria bacterium]|nr:DUF5663 domain-containing protein [Candidatus Saccharibacteria bacterium]